MEKTYAADENGIPWCSHDGCPQYNGNGECEISGDIMGMQCVCEPAIIEIIESRDKAQAKVTQTEIVVREILQAILNTDTHVDALSDVKIIAAKHGVEIE